MGAQSTILPTTRTAARVQATTEATAVVNVQPPGTPLSRRAATVRAAVRSASAERSTSPLSFGTSPPISTTRAVSGLPQPGHFCCGTLTRRPAAAYASTSCSHANTIDSGGQLHQWPSRYGAATPGRAPLLNPAILALRLPRVHRRRGQALARRHPRRSPPSRHRRRHQSALPIPRTSCPRRRAANGGHRQRSRRRAGEPHRRQRRGALAVRARPGEQRSQGPALRGGRRRAPGPRGVRRRHGFERHAAGSDSPTTWPRSSRSWAPSSARVSGRARDGGRRGEAAGCSRPRGQPVG
jgi:hypothetical protein